MTASGQQARTAVARLGRKGLIIILKCDSLRPTDKHSCGKARQEGVNHYFKMWQPLAWLGRKGLIIILKCDSLDASMFRRVPDLEIKWWFCSLVCHTPFKLVCVQILFFCFLMDSLLLSHVWCRSMKERRRILEKNMTEVEHRVMLSEVHKIKVRGTGAQE